MQKSNSYSQLQIKLKKSQRAEQIIRQHVDREILLRRMTQQIHQSLDLSTIFEIATNGIRQCFHTDRVGIFKFFPLSSSSKGEFISESVGVGFDSVLGILVHDDYFCENYITSYQQGRIQVVEDINHAELADCHRKMLLQFQIQSNLVLPLLKAGELWGLLCVHQCSSPRCWKEIEIDFIQHVANQLAIAIQQAYLLEMLNNELGERKQVQAQLVERNQQLTIANEKLSHATQLLEKLVNIDGLTKIANRRCFDDRLEQEWLRAYREHQPISLLLFDVDYFKLYNDAYGHQLGDDCLIKLAQATQQVVCRSADLIARYGGEEFVIILSNTDLKGAIAVAERIHAAIQALNIPHQASNLSNIVTVSLGITTLIPNTKILLTEIIHQADLALYCAKQQGRNQSAIFSG